MILATGAVHTHLIRQKLRTFVSLNVRSGECLDVHYFAVLIGVGATTVNAYLAQESIAERHRRGLFGDRLLEDCVQSYIKRSEEHTSELQSLMRISYAVFCLKKKKHTMLNNLPLVPHTSSTPSFTKLSPYHIRRMLHVKLLHLDYVLKHSFYKP